MSRKGLSPHKGALEAGVGRATAHTCLYCCRSPKLAWKRPTSPPRALRLYLGARDRAGFLSKMRGNAVVVGSTNGIGKAVACRLARDGFNIVAVGRDKPGRREEMLAHLNACSQSDGAKHEFRPCDAFSLAQVKACAEGVASDYATEGIDALVLTQGMATIQGFTPTAEGNDEKVRSSW